MSSQIVPDPKQKPAPKPAVPAAKPAAGAKPASPPSKPTTAAAPAKPSATAQPVATATSKPAAPPPAARAEQHEEQAAPERRGGAINQLISCGISMLVHILALLSMALMVTATPEKEKPREIVSTAAETVEEFEEFQEQPLDQPVTDAPQSNEPVVASTDVSVAPDVQVVASADAIEAAPLAVELTDFGSETAPATDLASSMGAIGGTGTGGGFGARGANAGKIAAASGGGPDTEQAVDRALKWFINHQMPDGGWSFDLTKCPSCQGQCSHGGERMGGDRCGATAMALLPFLGRGYTHREGPYKAQIEQGIAFLAGLSMDGKGRVYTPKGGGNMYSQGLAGIALSECYAMTQDPRLQAPTQLALNFIMDAQDPRGGGWRYGPKQPGDTSAVGWQLMALKSGNMAYLQVNPLVIKKAVEFLDSVQADDGAFYGYTDPAKGPGTTAVGLLCRMYLGWKKDHPALQRGVAHLAKLGPSKDLYFNYYATQIMHHMEGDMWISWNNKMKGMLLKAQASQGHEAGSFYDGVDSGHGADSAGRLYCTSLATMILEVYYRHLPIYKNQSVDEEFKE